jgi:predicted lipid-binding transport protein (Tim44 family)
MGSISLLILAAVAGFLFYQLRSVLGQAPQDKNKNVPDAKKTSSLSDRFIPQKDNIVDITKSSEDYEHRFIKVSPDINRDDIIQMLKKIKARYHNFDLNKFIEGAKGAYDMILESFNKNLPEEIKIYMSDDIYNNYRQLLDGYAEKNYKFETVVTRIEKAVITSVQTNEVSARITVELSAYNISCLKDETGNIIQGDPDNVTPVVDIWVFERLYTAHNSAWTVVAVA